MWHIPGTDPAAGEIIFSAHLFEGYVKQGGNDNISGSAALVEIGRTLNTLITEGRLPRPRRTIRFLIGPEFSGTGPWVKANKALMEKTLCNINLDMVGLRLSESQSFMCMMRTTFGNPHYLNDVMENYYRFVGEGNRERIQNRSTAYPVLQPHRRADGRRRALLLQHRDALRRVRPRGVQRLGRAGAGHHDDRRGPTAGITPPATTWTRPTRPS